jgi:hypothetical protein
VAVVAVALGAGAAAVAGSVVVVEVEAALETAVGVEVVDEAGSEIVEGVEAALTVVASATSLAKRLPSKATFTSIRIPSVRTQGPLHLALRSIRCAQITKVLANACYGHPFCIPAMQD